MSESMSNIAISVKYVLYEEKMCKSLNCDIALLIKDFQNGVLLFSLL